MELITTDYILGYRYDNGDELGLGEQAPQISSGGQLRIFLTLVIREKRYSSLKLDRAGTTFWVSGLSSAGVECWKLKIECDNADYEELEHMLGQLIYVSA